ncbi:LAFA_0F03422g1_1 [Lachancea sp. 'fantastica']|nr:LAFA_0F03422g1_1 [Lachancea sp. 'fantastica']
MARKIEWSQVGVSSGPTFLSPGLIAGKDSELLFTSGCVGNDASGQYPEDVESQTRNALENLKRVLAAGSTDLDHVLKVLLFVSDGAHAAAVNKVYRDYFPGCPARSCVVVSFPDSRLKVELECVAEVPGK